MDESIWKWILEHIETPLLLKIVKDAGIKVPGFRKLTVTVVNQFKKKLIADMVNDKNLTKMTGLFNHLYEPDGEYVGDMDYETIKEKLESGVLEPCQTLSLLLSSEKESDRERARRLFQDIPIEKLEHLAAKPETDANKEPLSENKNLSTIEKKWRKSEEKNRELKSQIEKERTVKQRLKRELNDELKNMKQEIIKLEQEVGRLNHENKVLYEENRKLQEENNELFKKLQQNEAVLAEWKSQVHEQHVITNEPIESGVPHKRKVAMIGDPKNHMILKAPLYDFSIFKPMELQSLEGEDSLDQWDEIWLLTYRTPLAQKLYVKRLVEKHKHKLLEFHSFVDIRNYIRERISP